MAVKTLLSGFVAIALDIAEHSSSKAAEETFS